MTTYLLVSLGIAAAMLAWLAIWAGIVGLIGRVVWRPLADRYPAERWPEGEGVALSWQSGAIGWSGYNGVLHAVLTEHGLYLRPLRAFAFQHPPMHIPWTAVVRTSRGMLGGVALHLPEGTLRLYGRLGRMAGDAVAATHGAAR